MLEQYINQLHLFLSFNLICITQKRPKATNIITQQLTKWSYFFIFHFQLVIPVALSFTKERQSHLLSIFTKAKLMGIFATNETGMLCYSDACDHLGSLEPGIQMKVFIMVSSSCSLAVLYNGDLLNKGYLQVYDLVPIV